MWQLPLPLSTVFAPSLEDGLKMLPLDRSAVGNIKKILTDLDFG